MVIMDTLQKIQYLSTKGEEADGNGLFTFSCSNYREALQALLIVGAEIYGYEAYDMKSGVYIEQREIGESIIKSVVELDKYCEIHETRKLAVSFDVYPDASSSDITSYLDKTATSYKVSDSVFTIMEYRHHVFDNVYKLGATILNRTGSIVERDIGKISDLLAAQHDYQESGILNFRIDL